MRWLILLLVTAALGDHRGGTRAEFLPPPRAWQPLAPGNHRVGFRTALAFDSTRPRAPSNSPRPIQIAVWYPATATAKPRMTYHDYLGLVAAETTYTAPENGDPAAETELRSTLSHRGADSADVSAWLRAPMTAVRDAPAEPRRFPLIVIAQGNGESPHDQAVIAEFLASHGYVVASCPSQTRISGPMTDENAVGRSAREEAQDLSFLIDRERIEANVLGGRVALVGHSFGARGALIAALTRHDVAALVSLDGGIGTATGLDSFQGALASAGDSVTVPILHIYETLDQAMAPNWTLLSSLRASPVWIARTTAMHHHHFTSLGGLGAEFPKLLSATGGNDTTTRQFAAVGALVLSFLKAATVAPRFDTDGWAKASARAPLRVRRLTLSSRVPGSRVRLAQRPLRG